KYQVKPEVLAEIQKDFYCGYSTDEEIKQSIEQVYKQDNYLMDPHTAVGYKVMRDYQENDSKTPMILLSTASPYKFTHVVAEAILKQKIDDDFDAMQAINKKTNLPIPKNLAEVWNLPVLHDDVIDKDKMEDYIQQKVEADFYDKN